MSGKRPRFLCLSLHPAWDRTISIERLMPGGVIRGQLLLAEPAGKGMNVIRDVAHLSRARVAALGFLPRRDRAAFLAALPAGRVTAQFIPVAGETRVNITLVETACRRDTHITSDPIQVSRAAVRLFQAALERRARRNDFLTLTGSLPGGFTLSDLRRALAACRRAGARVCVDTNGPALKVALESRPWLLKPNLEELSALVGRTLKGARDALRAAKSLLPLCPNLLVSLGREGALLVTPEGVWRAVETTRPKVIHTVGCGDALFAGFLVATAEGSAPQDALRFAVACGSACVCTPQAWLPRRSEAARFLPGIRLTPCP